MERETRNRLQAATRRARLLLEQELGEQLEGVFDIRLNGIIATEPGAHLGPTERLVRAKLVAAVEHHQGAGHDRKTAVAAYLREAAFTTLNRFVALKMLEARALVQQCVSRGDQSSGFREFVGLAPGLVDLPDDGYRLYLECLFDELGREVRVLFDRRDPASLLWPGRQALAELLAILNAPELSGVWGEDETIGWVYQYFNGEDERKQMRAESQAPRDSRELAVRNQFFTPRYVVQFLTDNPLGRTWYEMRQGNTRLAEQCEYLVRRSDEVFLGEIEPEVSEDDNSDLAFLRGKTDEIAPFVVPRGRWMPEQQTGDGSSERPYEMPWYDYDEAGSRLLRFAHGVRIFAWPDDPRKDGWMTLLDELNVGVSDDPVSGATQDLWDSLFAVARSERFGEGTVHTYALALTRIANEIRRRLLADRGTDATRDALATAPTLVRHRAPKDPRELKILDPACGSGHFLLYAFDLLQTIYEEAWADEYWPASEATGRPLRDDYPNLEALRQDVPGLILRHNLWGVDIDTRCAQIAALALWMRAQRAYQGLGIPRGSRPQIVQTNIVVAEPMPGEPALRAEFVASLADGQLRMLVERVFQHMEQVGEAGSLLRIEDEITKDVQELYGTHGEMFSLEDRERWQDAELDLLVALRNYAELAQDGAAYLRRLFAEDAARGFAFVDLCRQRYDVVLMNPPFGACALGWKRDFCDRTHNLAAVAKLWVQNVSGRVLSLGGVA
jgi:hypothetical protein